MSQMRIKKEHYSWDQFVRNDGMRERLFQPPVSLKLKKTRLDWFEHVERMREINSEMDYRRPVGRPRAKLKVVLRKNLGETEVEA